MKLAKKHLPELLEATYATGQELAVWAREVGRAFGRVVGSRETAFNLVRYQLADRVELENQFWLSSRRIERITTAYGIGTFSKGVYEFPRADFLSYFFPRRVVTTHTEIERAVGEPINLREARTAAGLGDVMGVVLHPDSGLACTLSAGMPRATQLARPERTTLTRYALHLETAVRLRLAPQAVAMILSPEGRVLHSTGGAALRHPVLAVERARSDAEQRLGVWTALVSGRYSMLEREERGVPRHYVLVENPPAGWVRRGLSPVEASVVQQTARGLPGKLIAYSLGVSPAMVSTALGAAAAKLGFVDTVELARAVRVLLEERSRFDVSALSSAERAVYELLLTGGTNREIGRERGTSARTVANQVAAILKKTGAPTRRALQLTA